MPETIPPPRRVPGSTVLPPTRTESTIVVAETHHFVIDHVELLTRHGERLAAADPETARQHGWTPAIRINAVLAFRLLLADSDTAEIAEQADRYGLRVAQTSTRATDTSDGSTLYEDHVQCDENTT
ncbi:hypothetical protein STHAL_33005 [Streptomyces halstedii]|uniref:Uncharacterized protein n=1 Tax=Streptomyces halstedii TaxID=1944 RepID=A0ABS6U155_STRHA|nr:hypothetical protein [Streptomyces halstedii]MBV7674267.1 hypothetical protein [Streptomyces halstedii]